MVGGWDGDGMKTAELIPSRCNIPSLPKGIGSQPSLILTDDNNILLCGGTYNDQECLELKNKNWVHHSHLTKSRKIAMAISMDKGTFIFGGDVHPQLAGKNFVAKKSQKRYPKIIKEAIGELKSMDSLEISVFLIFSTEILAKMGI